MSSVIITKEQLTAFERWELASFDSHPGAKRRNSPQETAAEMESIRRLAHDEGYAQGRDNGYEQGRNEGYAAGIQQARAEAAQIHSLLQNLHDALHRMDEQLAQSLLDLSLEVARKMVSDILQAKPEVVLETISKAISGLPHFNQNAHLVLNPDDAELVRKHMGEQLSHAGWKIFTDSQIERGGCRAETAHSRVDATVEARWKRVVESMGQNKPWQT